MYNSNNEKNEIERRISQLILGSELEYVEIAKLCGVERSTVGKWAKTGKITLHNFSRLCSVLNVDIEHILNLKKEPDDELILLSDKIKKLNKNDPRIALIKMLLSLNVKY
ncbi:hypothetical protein VXS05_19425 [Photobacterium toruni]|uniref:hypothetical protein n=1 Tax=Photobacterium toruni TaxID=1935446 RepID=UPI002E19B82C|nr:hypothetical protein [Photobacterium toruni]